MLKIADEILMTKPTTHGKTIWEDIPGRGNAVQGHKGGRSWQSLGPKRRLWRSGRWRVRPGRDGPQEGDKQNHAEPFNPGWRICS